MHCVRYSYCHLERYSVRNGNCHIERYFVRHGNCHLERYIVRHGNCHLERYFVRHGNFYVTVPARKVLYIHYCSHLMRYFVCHGNCYLERFNELLTCLTCIGNILDTRAGPFNHLFALRFVHFRVCTSLVNERYLANVLDHHSIGFLVSKKKINSSLKCNVIYVEHGIFLILLICYNIRPN